MTDESEDVSVYFKEVNINGILGVEFYLHKEEEDELKIHLNNPSLHRKPYLENLTKLSIANENIYFEGDGKAIRELSHLKNANQLELYDMKNHRLEILRGTVKIPKDGIMYRAEDGKIKDLTTINGKSLAEIQARNLELLNAKKDFSSLYSFVVRWENLNSLDDNHKIINQLNTATRPSLIIQYYEKNNRWRVISHGSSESPKIFETPFGMPISLKNLQRPRRDVIDHRFFNTESNAKLNAEVMRIDSIHSNFTQQQPSVKEFGDFWLNSTDVNSNLMLAYTLIKRWTNDKLNGSSAQNDIAMTSTECQIFASNAVHDFSERLVEISLSCGIPTVMREILSEIKIQKIIHGVEVKCTKNSIDEIGRYLLNQVIMMNKWKIITRSSEKQFNTMQKKTAKFLAEFANNLKKTDDARWNRAGNSQNRLEV